MMSVGTVEAISKEIKECVYFEWVSSAVGQLRNARSLNLYSNAAILIQVMEGMGFSERTIKKVLDNL